MESIELTPKHPNLDIKTIQIKEGEKEYKCQIQIIQDLLQITLNLQDELKYEGRISLSNIQNQLPVFNDYQLEEIFYIISRLNISSFKLIKELNKFILKIEFNILNRKKYLSIILGENGDIKTNDLIKNISELKEMITTKDNIIKSKDEEIKALKDELKEYRLITISDANDYSYNNFDIKLKEPKHKFKYHSSWISCSTILKDGRFATGSGDNSIIIYNKKTLQPDLIIKEHNGEINCIALSSGILASCSSDNTIKIFNITEHPHYPNLEFSI